MSCLLDRCRQSQRFSKGSRIVDALLGDMQMCKELLELADREARVLDLGRMYMHMHQNQRDTHTHKRHVLFSRETCRVFEVLISYIFRIILLAVVLDEKNLCFSGLKNN